MFLFPCHDKMFGANPGCFLQDVSFQIDRLNHRKSWRAALGWKPTHGVQRELVRSWRGAGEKLARSWRGVGEELVRSWRGAGEELARSCVSHCEGRWLIFRPLNNPHQGSSGGGATLKNRCSVSDLLPCLPALCEERCNEPLLCAGLSLKAFWEIILATSSVLDDNNSNEK